MSNLIPARCNPNPIDLSALADDTLGILVDGDGDALLTGTERSGTGFTYEHERQKDPEP